MVICGIILPVSYATSASRHGSRAARSRLRPRRPLLVVGTLRNPVLARGRGACIGRGQPWGSLLGADLGRAVLVSFCCYERASPPADSPEELAPASERIAGTLAGRSWWPCRWAGSMMRGRAGARLDVLLPGLLLMPINHAGRCARFVDGAPSGCCLPAAGTRAIPDYRNEDELLGAGIAPSSALSPGRTQRHARRAAADEGRRPPARAQRQIPCWRSHRDVLLMVLPDALTTRRQRAWRCVARRLLFAAGVDVDGRCDGLVRSLNRSARSVGRRR